MVVYVGMNERKVGKDPLEDFYRGMEGLIEVLASEYPSTERFDRSKKYSVGPISVLDSAGS